ncbi:MAG: hypothetical protein J1D87_04960 [Lachnospiraceae bacterium]|nr:hypothetical protein [Lachnospiraceae bacterium]
MEKNLYKIFNNADQSLQIDEKRKNDTLLFLQKKVNEKQIRLINNKKQILWNQLRYMDKSVFMLHILIFVIMLPVMTFMKQNGNEIKDIIITNVILSGLMGTFSIIEISRVFFSGIAELSESCYFNVRQIVAFYMFISGVINITLLSIGIIFVSYSWKIELLRIGLYILVPFVFTECCCLGVLLTEAGRKNSYLLVIAGIFVIVFHLILSSSLELYNAAALFIWLISFTAGLIILVLQIKILFSGIKEGEIICMN